jgi:hypothetical protein
VILPQGVLFHWRQNLRQGLPYELGMLTLERQQARLTKVKVGARADRGRSIYKEAQSDLNPTRGVETDIMEKSQQRPRRSMWTSSVVDVDRI